MNFDLFLNGIIEELRRRLGSSYLVSNRTVRKNNGVVRHGIVISDNVHKVSPCYYIDDYYELYHKPGDLEIAAEDIIKNYREEKTTEASFVWLRDKEQILKQVLFRLVSTDRNTELLKDVPHHDLPELGLSVLFYLMVDVGSGSNGTILLWNHHMEMLKASKEELLECALRNTPLTMGYAIMNMAELLNGGVCKMACGTACFDGMFSMYVVTNRQKLYGAGCILYPGILDRIAQKLGADFYILPSSIHEVIALPSKSFEKCQADDLKTMVMDINKTELACEEVLTDNVYYYSRNEQKLFLAA